MSSVYQDSERGPSHACPHCGEWFDVEGDGRQTWLVSQYGNDEELTATVWTEAADKPLCPLDAAELDEFKIAVN